MLSVVTPATARNLTTLDAVWQDLGISSGGPADLYLNGVIPQASAAVETWCGRTFAVQSYAETFRCAFGDLTLSVFPVVALASITVDGTPIDLASAAVDTRLGIIGMPRRGLCPMHRGDVVVTYSAGYVLPTDPASPLRTLPADIERAALLLVKAAYHARDRDPTIRSEDVTGIGSTAYGLAGIGSGVQLPPDVEGLLQRYRTVTSG